MIKQLDEDALRALVRPDLVAFDPTVRDLEPLAVGARTMCRLLSISEGTLQKLIADGLPVVKLDGKNLFPVQLAREWLAAKALNSTKVPK